MHVIICLFKPIGCKTQREKFRINSVLLCIMTWLYTCVFGKNGTILASGVNSGRYYEYVGAGDIYWHIFEISVPPSQLCCKPKIVIKVLNIKWKCFK